MEIKSTIRCLLIISLFVLIVVLSVISSVAQNHTPVNAEIASVRQIIKNEQHIIHAGGYLRTHDGQTVNYTNSYDALQNMYKSGNRICEIDIRRTTDDVLICAHGDSSHLAQGSDLPVTASSVEFMEAKIYNEFQPMDVSLLVDFMRNHNDLLIITDVKEDNIQVCKQIASQYPDVIDQFIVQIYHFSEYDSIRELGFQYIIFTAYQANPEERSLWNMAQFAKDHELVGLTVERRFFENDNYLRIAHLVTGVPFMLHTVNDYSEINYLIRSKLAIGIYTDQIVFPAVI